MSNLNVSVSFHLQNVIKLIQQSDFFTSVEVLNVYLFGSRAYGCATPESDYDLIAVVNSTNFFFSSQLVETEVYNINVYHRLFFEDLLYQHLLAVRPFSNDIQTYD